MVMIIVLVLFVSIYMMVAGHIKKDKTAVLWGRIMFVATGLMLVILQLTK